VAATLPSGVTNHEQERVFRPVREADGGGGGAVRAPHGGGLRGGAVYNLNPVDPYLESAWFQPAPGFEPFNLKGEKLFSSLCFQIQLVPLHRGCRATEAARQRRQRAVGPAHPRRVQPPREERQAIALHAQGGVCHHAHAGRVGTFHHVILQPKLIRLMTASTATSNS
jgi:hypothetical protein